MASDGLVSVEFFEYPEQEQPSETKDFVTERGAIEYGKFSGYNFYMVVDPRKHDAPQLLQEIE